MLPRFCQLTAQLVLRVLLLHMPLISWHLYLVPLVVYTSVCTCLPVHVCRCTCVCLSYQSSSQGADSPRGPKRAAKRRLVDSPGDYPRYGDDVFDKDALMAMASAVNGSYAPRFPFMSTNGGPVTPLRPNEDEALRAAKERRRARARKVYSSEEEEEEEEGDYLSMLKVGVVVFVY